MAVAAAGVVAVIQGVPVRDRSVKASTSQGIAVETALIRLRPELEDRFELKGVVEPNRVGRVPAEVSETIDFIAPRNADKLRAQALANTRELASRVMDPDRLADMDPEVLEMLAEYAICKELVSDEAEAIDKGDKVVRGQPLLYLNTDRLLAAYNQARAQMEYDLRELEKYRRLESEGGASIKDVEDRRLLYETSRASMEAARANLLRAVVRSPIEGTLNRLMVERGELVGPGSANVTVAEVVDESRLKVAVDIPEADIAYFQLGQEHTVTEVAGRAVERKGTVSYISKTAEGSARKTRIELLMDPEARSVIRPGNIVTVRLRRRILKNVVLAPLQAIIPGNNQKIAYVSSEGRAQRRLLEIDLRTVRGTDVLVRSGLTPGDRLIVRGHRQCADGQKIREVPMEMTLESVVEYDVSGEVDASQLSDVTRRFSQALTQVRGVAGVSVLEPGDALIPITLQIQELARRGVNLDRLGKLLDLQGPARGQDDEISAWLIRRHDRGYDQMPLRHRVLLNDDEGMPVFVWQVTSWIGSADVMPTAAPRLVVSAVLQDASRQEVRQEVAEPIAAALKGLGARDVAIHASPDIAHVEATFCQGAGDREIRAAGERVVSDLVRQGRLPEQIEGPVVAGRPGLPARRMLIVARPGASEAELADRIARKLDAFQKDKAALTAGLRFARTKAPADAKSVPAVVAGQSAQQAER
jgi:RND family efflux transporter MFP subunit